MLDRDAGVLQGFLCTAGTGPRPIIRGGTPAEAPATTRPAALAPAGWPVSPLVSSTAAAPSFNPEELPAVTAPSLRNAGRSLSRATSWMCPARALIRGDQPVALLLRYRHRDNLLGKPAGIDGRDGALVERTAKHPASSRVRCGHSAIFSAVSPIDRCRTFPAFWGWDSASRGLYPRRSGCQMESLSRPWAANRARATCFPRHRQ